MNKQELKEYMELKKKEDLLWDEVKDLVVKDGEWEEIRNLINELVETNLELEDYCNK